MARREFFTSNHSENLVAASFHAAGWMVYRHGWPDFLFEKDGQLRFVEVKTRSTFISRKTGRPMISKAAKLSRSQKRIRKALAAAGIYVQVVHVNPAGQPVRPGGRADQEIVLTWEEVLSYPGGSGRATP